MSHLRFIVPGLLIVLFFVSCERQETATEILQKTIASLDNIETLYYKQDMERTNPRNIQDTIFRYREMYFKRLISDSIVGVKGHWYMYVEDKVNVIYEDIYDGHRLIRKNNRDSVARIYDLREYPEFKNSHFWSHNTPYAMQYEFRYMLKNPDFYSIKRLNDTIINLKDCYQILVRLENKKTMPGFALKLEDDEKSISKTLYFIDKPKYFPVRVKGERFYSDKPEQTMFMDQKYYDIKFNPSIDENIQFNTSLQSLKGIEKKVMKPE